MKKTRYEVESDMNWLAKEVAEEYEVESDFYGDCYPNEIMSIENKMERAKSEEEYDDLLYEARIIFESYIQ